MGDIVKKRVELKWSLLGGRYWVEPGEVAILQDAGNIYDPDGRPKLYNAGSAVRARYRLLPFGKQQVVIVFDTKIQGQPVRISNQSFNLPFQGLVIALSAEVFYRIKDPVPLLEETHLDNDAEIAAAVYGRVMSLIQSAIKDEPLPFVLGSQMQIRDILMSNHWLSQTGVFVTDFVIHSIMPPPVILAAQESAAAQVIQLEFNIRQALALGIDPSFEWLMRTNPQAAQSMLDTASTVLGTLAQVPGGLGERITLDTVTNALASTITKVKQSMGIQGGMPAAHPGGPQLAAVTPPILNVTPAASSLEAGTGEDSLEPGDSGVDLGRIYSDAADLSKAGFSPNIEGSIIMVKIDEDTIALDCPPEFPQRGPAVTIYHGDGSSEVPQLDVLAVWSPSNHLLDVVNSLTNSATA